MTNKGLTTYLQKGGNKVVDQMNKDVENVELENEEVNKDINKEVDEEVVEETSSELENEKASEEANQDEKK